MFLIYEEIIFFKAHPFYADLMLAVLISIIALILIMLGLRFFTHHGKEYEVPDFSDYNIEQIERYAKDSNQYDFQLTINDSVFEPTKKEVLLFLKTHKPE